MSFKWTPHRFAGGALALDVANSVILRSDPEHSVDRFAIREQIESFCEAASLMSAENARFSTLLPPLPGAEKTLIDLREATDRYFRARIVEDGGNNTLLAELLIVCAQALRAHEADDLAAATAHSVLSLVHGPEGERIRICGNCGWLFIDRSKNRSRIWCDMAVCGNRQKASRHYRRTKESAL